MAAAATMAPAPALMTRSPMAGSGSQTQTQAPILRVSQPVLRLRGADTARKNKKKIQWAEDVVDNEGLGRKSSKVCCIYHAPKPIDESSDESSSDDSSSDDDSGLDDDRARPIGGRRGRGRDEHHGHGEGCSHNHGHGKGKGKRPASPNAYEKMPKVKEGAQARKNS